MSIVMNLNNVANIAEIISMLFVVGGVIFGLKQLQHYKQQLKAQAASELARSFHNSEFVFALRRLYSLTEEEYKNNLRHKGKSYEDSAMLVSLTIEPIAIMVHRRIVTIDMVWELMGGILTSVWPRLYPWVLEQRQIQGSEKFNEWAQWLVEQFENYAIGEQSLPAHKKYKHWKPFG